MKTYNEMADSVFERGEKIIVLKNKKRARIKRVLILASLAAVLCATVVYGAFLIEEDDKERISDSSGTAAKESAENDNSIENDSLVSNDTTGQKIIWADGAALSDMSLGDWNGKTVTDRLWLVLERDDIAPDYAIAIYPEIRFDDEYVYGQKKYGELCDEERKMQNHLRQLEYLLSVWRNDDGSYIEEYRQKNIAESKYFIDGEFAEDKLLQDIQTVKTELHLLEQNVTDAQNAYRDELLCIMKNQLCEAKIPYEVLTSVDTDYSYEFLIFYATKQQFAELLLDDRLADNTVFYFATKNMRDGYLLCEVRDL